MAKAFIDDTHLTDIADAIRAKLGVSTQYLPSEMAAAIRSIPSCGYFYVQDISGTTNTLSIVKNNPSAPTIAVEYSLDSIIWQTLGSTSTTALTLNIPAYERVYLRAEASQWATATDNYNYITASDSHNVGGNIMSLLYGANFKGQTALTTSYTLANLFKSNSTLISAEHLQLPATTLVSVCYYNMFTNCTSLTTAPQLSATTLATYCYGYMFFGCTSLTSAPVLLATTLISRCYRYMFRDCTALNEVITYANDVSATDCLQGWLYNVSATGNFFNLGGAIYSSDSSGIPSGWTEHTSL